MATDKLINHSQGEDIISKLNSIATNIATVGNISLPSLGMGYTTCATAAATAAKTATLTGYTISDGGYVSVKFTNAVGAGATLNINSQGAKAIYYQGAAITANVIKAGDIATFVYANNQYQLISLDNPYSDAQLAALNSTATKAKIDQIATNQNNILLKADKISFGFSGNPNPAVYEKDWDFVPDGIYLLAYICSQDASTRRGVSVYMFTKYTTNHIVLFTPVAEASGAIITSCVASGSAGAETITFTLAQRGYHTATAIQVVAF